MLQIHLPTAQECNIQLLSDRTRYCTSCIDKTCPLHTSRATDEEDRQGIDKITASVILSFL